jgi:hypothetical protein
VALPMAISPPSAALTLSTRDTTRRGAPVDYQVLFNVAFTLSVFLAGWVLNGITATVKRLDDDVRAMPIHYVNKEDYRIDIRELKELTQKVIDKLDGKADKPRGSS